MGCEIEIKFRVADHAALEHRLLEIGASPTDFVEQSDAYLAHPARDFARTDEALRIRRDGSVNRITYKGPKQGGPTKTREEIEVAFADGPEALADVGQIFDRLGFRPVTTVRKMRRAFHLVVEGRSIEVTLDEVEGIGTFAEVETLADPDDVTGAQDAVLELARAIGLDEVEPRSYLRMLLERDGPSEANPTGQP